MMFHIQKYRKQNVKRQDFFRSYIEIAFETQFFSVCDQPLRIYSIINIICYMTSAKKSHQVVHELGPWSQSVGHQILSHQTPNNPQLPTVDTQALRLPRVIARSNRARNNLSNFPVKIQKIQLKDYKINNQSILKRNSKTINIDSHISNFQHKRYPKSSRKEINSYRYDIDLLHQGFRLASIQLGSTIQMQSQQLQNSKKQAKKSVSIQKQFARKRSLIQLIKYLKIMDEGSPIFKKPKPKKSLNHNQLAQISALFKSRQYYPHQVSPNLIKKN